MKHRIVAVDENSIAQELGLEPGDTLLAIDGEDVVDLIDYEALCAGESLTVTAQKPDGTLIEGQVEKEDWEPLGLSFEKDLMGPLRCCANNCIFCFVDQMRPGLRESLYVKDDDWRMSMVMGNFVTLTNVSDKELERIIRRHASPLYISVHTTNPALRASMMNQPRAAKILDQLKKLSAAGIKMHCQLVLCPGYNDGKELERSISDLYQLKENVLSVAVVPVGLTAYRDHLPKFSGFDGAGARDVVCRVEEWQKKARAETGRSFVYASDEFYVLSDKPLPSGESYDGYPQIENGVGMLRKFEDELEEALADVKEGCLKGRQFTLVCGVSAQKWSRHIAGLVMDRTGAKIDAVTVDNDFFGETVTVTGLLVERDVEAELKKHALGDGVLIPKNMLREGTEVFLDGGTVSQLKAAIGCPVRPFEVEGQDFVDVLLGRVKED